MWVSETNCPVPRGIGFGAELIGSGTGTVSTIALLAAGKKETSVKSLNKMLIRYRYRYRVPVYDNNKKFKIFNKRYYQVSIVCLPLSPKLNYPCSKYTKYFNKLLQYFLKYN